MKAWILAAALATAVLPAAGLARDHHGGPHGNGGWRHGETRHGGGWRGGDAWRGGRREPGGPHARRGRRLPPGWRGEAVQDYRRHHLRRPPPGFAWYRDGDAWVLGAEGSGMIFDVVPRD